MRITKRWQDIGDFAVFFDGTIERAFRLAMLATGDVDRAGEATRRAYGDLWITSREPDALRPEVRLLALVRGHAKYRGC